MEDAVNPPQQHSPQQSANSKKQPRRGRVFLLVLVLLLAIAGTGYFLYQQRAEEDDYPTSLVSGTVYISEQSLNPATITIKAGESVTWVNNDDDPHQIVSDPHPQHETLPGLNSADQIKTGDSFTYTFGETGTYTYHDELNPYVVKGTVVVE